MLRRQGAAVGASVAAGLLLLAGCGGSGSSRGTQDQSASPSISAAQQLATLAKAATAASYIATYELHTSTSPSATPAPTGSSGTSPATVVVYRSPTALRLDVISKTGIAVLIENGQGRFSCRVAGAKKVCFKVAPPNGTLPPEFDPGLQLVFTSYVKDLAKNAAGYDVRRAGTTAGAGEVPPGQCFVVGASGSSSNTPSAAGSGAGRLSAGTYCLADTGVLTKASFASSSLHLVKLAPAPTAKQLQPLVSPTPLPSAAPTG